MSSIIAHGLTARIIGKITGKPIEPHKYNTVWMIWLIIIAILPDLDYVIPFLYSSSNGGFRITHSVLAVLFVPTFTITALVLFRVQGTTLSVMSIQAILAGLSHLVLDIFVGVSHFPLFWPLSMRIYKLPYGILPSAGAIYLSNPYLYLNLFIEMGIIVPITVLFFRPKQLKLSDNRQVLFNGVLVFISGLFMYWAYTLPR